MVSSFVSLSSLLTTKSVDFVVGMWWLPFVTEIVCNFHSSYGTAQAQRCTCMHESICSWLNNCQEKGHGTHFAHTHSLTSVSAILASKMGATLLYSTITQSRANRLMHASATLNLGCAIPWLQKLFLNSFWSILLHNGLNIAGNEVSDDKYISEMHGAIVLMWYAWVHQ